MNCTNFKIGEKFPLPIQNQGNGGLFQVDINGAMFILQLSRTDIIAVEAFRTGKMELALYEEDGILFLLYQIDGIFKEGWGDAPLALHLLKQDQLPDVDAENSDPDIHLYLVDTRLQLLLAQRDIKMSEAFQTVIKKHLTKQLAPPMAPSTFMQKLQKIWQSKTSAQMRQQAQAVLPIELNIPALPKKEKSTDLRTN